MIQVYCFDFLHLGQSEEAFGFTVWRVVFFLENPFFDRKHVFILFIIELTLEK